ncbi:hypothetical protein NUACC21_33350 [Scytonema sp. NUACC21]
MTTTSNVNSTASSNNVFPQLSGDVLNAIQNNISTFTDIVSKYRSGNAVASNDLALAPVVEFVNYAYGSNSPFLNGTGSGSTGNSTVTGSGSVFIGNSPVTGTSNVSGGTTSLTDSNSVLPTRSPSDVLKLIEADITNFYNTTNLNSGIGGNNQLPQSASDVFKLLQNDIASYSNTINQLQSATSPIAGGSDNNTII